MTKSNNIIDRNKRSYRFVVVIQASLLLIALITLSHQFHVANCEAKEFDWSDLGVSLSGPKSSLSSNAANNLRILVSPQRRITKNYDIDYGNNSQPTLSAQGETTYIVPGSGNSYVSQSGSQVSTGNSGHSSAYSALSASLASLKNRLNARGVSISNSDVNSQSGLYQSSAISDQQQQSQQQNQAQSQPTYLSVSSQQEPQLLNGGGYNSLQNQSNDNNKTIVLAIPAKINFLTGSSSANSINNNNKSQQQQAQQLTVIQQQPTQDQQNRAEYSTKQIGVIANQEGATIDQNGQLVSTGAQPDQEHHQYVILNQSPAQVQDPQTQLVATSKGLTQQGQIPAGALYQTGLYSTVQQANIGSYPIKYIQSYQQPAAIQQPAVRKVYTTGSDQTVTYETQYGNNADQQTSSRYTISCLDTCNSGDPRWRKYSISKYKACCSRSIQYDPQFEQPSAERVSEVGSKYSDDAYYNYLYRKSRARRSRRPHRSNKYNRYTSSANSDDDGIGSAGSGSAGVESGSDSGRTTSGRFYYHDSSSPYLKYYKNRQPSPDSAELADPVPTPTGKYSPKERSYRRGRARDFSVDAQDSQPGNNHELNEDESPYVSPDSQPIRNSPSGYGQGEYAVGEGGRYPVSDARNPNEEDDVVARGYEQDGSEQESGKSTSDGADHLGSGELAPVSPEGAAGEETNEPPETTTSHKYSASSSSRRRKQHGKSRSRKTKDSKYYSGKKGRRGNKYAKQQEHSSSQTNGTDYDSAQPGDQTYHPEPSNSGDQEDQSYQKDTTGTETLSDGGIEKYKPSLNDSAAVANLSKTTMHLTEILSMLEKKAQSKLNESLSAQQQSTYQQPQPQPLSPVIPTSTQSPPITTTGLYPLSSILNSQYSGISGLQSALSNNDYITSELSLKSPYRYESTSLSSPLGSSSLSLPSSYSSLSSDAFNQMAAFGQPSQYTLGSSKHLSLAGSPAHQTRKRRVNNKNIRYGGLMQYKSHGPLSATSSLLQHASRSPLLNPAYYGSSLQYPYWYPARPTYSSVTNSYPYKNLNKSPYSSFLGGPVSSKLAAAAAASTGLYTDDTTRFNALSNYDSIGTSPLRQSGMRLRSKPFVFQPQVLPIYTRHSILTQPLDVKKK